MWSNNKTSSTLGSENDFFVKLLLSWCEDIYMILVEIHGGNSRLTNLNYTFIYKGIYLLIVDFRDWYGVMTFFQGLLHDMIVEMDSVMEISAMGTRNPYQVNAIKLTIYLVVQTITLMFLVNLI